MDRIMIRLSSGRSRSLYGPDPGVCDAERNPVPIILPKIDFQVRTISESSASRFAIRRHGKANVGRPYSPGVRLIYQAA